MDGKTTGTGADPADDVNRLLQIAELGPQGAACGSTRHPPTAICPLPSAASAAAASAQRHCCHSPGNHASI